MNVVFITQDEPFYLRESIEHILDNLPEGVTVKGVVSLSPSPFGKKLSLLEKAWQTISIFGVRFFFFYGIKLVKSKIFGKGVTSMLRRRKLRLVELQKSINSSASLEAIRACEPDLLVSIQGNEIFKNPLINLAPLGCINLHTAMLPKYRGLMPSFWVLRNRETSTGVSVFFVDEGIDSGPILVQREINISGMTHAALISLSKQVGAECVVEALQKIKEGNVITIPNDDSKMTYCGFPSREDVVAFRSAGAKFF